MPVLYRLTMMSFLALASWGHGEGTPAGSPTPNGSGSPAQNLLNPNAIKTLDADFFDEKKKEKSATTNASGRYYGEEPDYTSDKREEWLKECARFKEKDGEAYRKCYQEKKANFKRGLRDSSDAIERRQNEPLRNTNPLLEDQRNSLPSGFGDD